MFAKKLFIILIFLIGLISPAYATITFLEGRDTVSLLNTDHSNSIQFDVTSLGTYNIKSNNLDFNIDFNVTTLNYVTIIIIDNAYLVAPKINAAGVPELPCSLNDTVTITGQGDSATVTVDSTRPQNNAILSVASNPSYGDSNGNFYSGGILVTPTGSIKDENTGDVGISNYIYYVIPISGIDNYSSSSVYKKKYAKGTSYTAQDINSLEKSGNISIFPDGNYFVVIDANDLADNYSSSTQVKATKQNFYIDNSPPTLSSVITTAVGTITTNKLYSKDRSFPLTVVLNDVSGIAGGALTVSVAGYYGYSKQDLTYDSNFSLSQDDIEKIVQGFVAQTGDIYLVNINAGDSVGNVYNYDFNILIDLNKPSMPTTTVAIEDIDKNVTISSTKNSNDTGGSNIKEYRVYKGSSSFIDSSGKELVCTMTTQTSCVDSEDKSLDSDIYYGVVAVDNAGNISDANSQKVWTGPKACTISVNGGAEFTNTGDVNVNISYPSSGADVNEMGFSCTTAVPTFVLYSSGTKSFNVISGTGCNATNGERTVYARVKSEEFPTRFSICSDTIDLDNTAPTTPTNLQSTPQSDGSARLTWTASTETVSPTTVSYRIYYSTSSNVTTANDYKTSTTNSYLFSSNIDQNLYFKISALDLRNNESALSTAVLANVKKIGPRFVITLDPANDINGEVYATSGTKTINFVSDESLTGNPQVSIKTGSSSTYTNITSTYDNTTKRGFATQNFSSSGVNTIKITGTNTKGEQAYSELEFTLDGTAPDFNFTQQISDLITYRIGLYNLPTDVFKVEYSVDDINSVCVKQQVTDYNCVYDTRITPDGNHTMFIKVYDKALNKKTKSFTYTVNNIDEEKVACVELKEEIASRLNTILENLELYRSVDMYELIDQNINDKITIVNTKRGEGNEKYASEDYVGAKADYLFATNELTLIEDMLPDITIVKSTTTKTGFDANTTLNPETILDANISKKTKELYDQNIISTDRNFEVLKIGNQNFFSVVLTINNTSASAKVITVVETIPKNFANNVSKLTFNKQVEVLVKDPVIKHTLTIPAKSSENITYRSLTPITDLDKETKYNAIKFNAPLIIDGNISADKLKLPKQINMNILIYFFSIVIILIILIVIITAINNFRNKKMEEIKPETKKVMNDYLATSKEKPDLEKLSTPDLQKSETKTTEEKKPEEKKEKGASDKFNEDYQYILSSIKKR